MRSRATSGDETMAPRSGDSNVQTTLGGRLPVPFPGCETIDPPFLRRSGSQFSGRKKIDARPVATRMPALIKKGLFMLALRDTMDKSAVFRQLQAWARQRFSSGGQASPS